MQLEFKCLSIWKNSQQLFVVIPEEGVTIETCYNELKDKFPKPEYLIIYKEYGSRLSTSVEMGVQLEKRDRDVEARR